MYRNIRNVCSCSESPYCNRNMGERSTTILGGGDESLNVKLQAVYLEAIWVYKWEKKNLTPIGKFYRMIQIVYARSIMEVTWN